MDLNNQEAIIYALIIAFFLAAVLFFILWLKVKQDRDKLRKRFAPVIEIDKEIEKVTKEKEALDTEVINLKKSYKEKRKIYDSLLSQIAIFDEQISFAEYGVYEPHFDFSDSEAYKTVIKEVRAQQKEMVKLKTATTRNDNWTVDGSKAKGRTMNNRAVRLALRAFNAEADAAIANSRWNNAEAMIKRIGNARKQIDKANDTLGVYITEGYFNRKIKELRLTHEYRERLKVERDERSEVSRLQREEKRLEREAKEALEEEKRYEMLLEKARKEIGASSSEAQKAKILELENQLEQAHQKTERAQAMAERTKTGFVYIISNIGSFGEDVVKIGLTRRLDPNDRVKELGDASVPFLFDTHAMIYSEEAPALEAALHTKFEDRRINTSNMRKEFFRASLEEVQNAVAKLAPDADFHEDVEAQEFRETVERRRQKLEFDLAKENLQFPIEL